MITFLKNMIMRLLNTRIFQNRCFFYFSSKVFDCVFVDSPVTRRLFQSEYFFDLSSRVFDSIFFEAPKESDLLYWAVSEWLEYQPWIFHHELITRNDWCNMRKKALLWKNKPLISVVTPVYNTNIGHLLECIDSVVFQTYPNWEMCVVDDGSSNQEIIEVLKRFNKKDSRIRLSLTSSNKGITHATNKALEMAEGDYIAFLDHDDRLSVDALYHVASTINKNSAADILYSDKDMLSGRGLRFMHMFRPDWSPELLLSYNYVCHLMVYRRALIKSLNGVRQGFEGSQDYDLILRAMELNPSICHIPRVLYHWRQHEQSVSMNYDSKEYAWKSGVRALQETIKRRGLEGEASEIEDLWRGNYRVKMRSPATDSWGNISLDPDSVDDDYVEILSKKIPEMSDNEYIVILGTHIKTDDEEKIRR